MQNDIKKILKIIVKNPDGILFEGEAQSLTTANKNGPLDILPLHENFISRIQDKLVIHQDNKHQELQIISGIMKVSSNIVQIFLGLESMI